MQQHRPQLQGAQAQRHRVPHQGFMGESHKKKPHYHACRSVRAYF